MGLLNINIQTTNYGRSSFKFLWNPVLRRIQKLHNISQINNLCPMGYGRYIGNR